MPLTQLTQYQLALLVTRLSLPWPEAPRPGSSVRGLARREHVVSLPAAFNWPRGSFLLQAMKVLSKKKLIRQAGFPRECGGLCSEVWGLRRDQTEPVNVMSSRHSGKTPHPLRAQLNFLLWVLISFKSLKAEFEGLADGSAVNALATKSRWS